MSELNPKRRLALIKIPLSPNRDNRPVVLIRCERATERPTFIATVVVILLQIRYRTLRLNSISPQDTHSRGACLALAKFGLKSARTIHQILIGELSPTHSEHYYCPLCGKDNTKLWATDAMMMMVWSRSITIEWRCRVVNLVSVLVPPCLSENCFLIKLLENPFSIIGRTKTHPPPPVLFVLSLRIVLLLLS